MNEQEVMVELLEKGNAFVKKIYMSHGAAELLSGVKMTVIRALQKRIKTDHDLAIALYRTGNGDAMTLAGLIADPKRATAENRIAARIARCRRIARRSSRLAARIARCQRTAGRSSLLAARLEFDASDFGVHGRIG
ncbi:hypothetical protein ACFPPD_20590 [Cohnella suwonensis]|uniref:Uncharacterized protein n=1 Tax=Cohnella suwonensis TaxID=696072 RepID=A0ABW0M1E0_9BACL